jgi:hypothetical protein
MTELNGCHVVVLVCTCYQKSYKFPTFLCTLYVLLPLMLYFKVLYQTITTCARFVVVVVVIVDIFHRKKLQF